jgi:hydrogenase maturation protein HypF
MILTDIQPFERYRLTVTGVVQGVGFRPFVYGLAARHGLAGFVGNHSGGVFIEIEGPETALAGFQRDLVGQAPPLAHIERVAVEKVAVQGDVAFTIVHSQAEASANTLISPDICLCDDCLRELFDPADRRYRYPFINCTNCGPRFTIIQDIPYDRPYTTMAGFAMCPACQAEYENPLDRRFHAQPNACPVCGPQLWLEFNPHLQPSNPDFPSPEKEDALQVAQQLLAAGKIVAVKGLGGFHLACDATHDEAVQTLRQRKGRVDKPFAVMALDVETIRQFAELSPEEETLLSSKERPIVLLPKKPGGCLSEFIAPGNPYIGVMLPYTPLHYLLLSALPPEKAKAKTDSRNPKSTPVRRAVVNPRPSDGQSKILIMTSANHSDEPIVKDNPEARERLSHLADAFLFHNRDIHTRCDDSVVRVFQGAELPLRRSRGYAPFPVKLPLAIPPTLAVGGELKSTFCLTKDGHAFMSQHIGDMENLETMAAFGQAVAHFKHIFRIEPELIACDMHPGYLSTRWAQENANGLPLVSVQHHHAHVAAVMAEHQSDGTEPVIGFSFDGTGYGLDGAIWGGEVFIADYHGFERAAHLKYTPLVGGDAAVKRPYRLALAHLWAAGIPWNDRLPCAAACPEVERRVIKRQLETGLNAVPTSSFGRLFDAVASLAGVRHTVTYEAQAAIEFEALAAPGVETGYAFDWDGSQFDAAPVIQAVAADMLTGLPVPVIAAKFHYAVADLIVQISLRLRRQTGLNRVALSGGVFQNTTLLKLATGRLRAHEFAVLTHHRVPPNDGGLALGQAVIGAMHVQ